MILHLAEYVAVKLSDNGVNIEKWATGDAIRAIFSIWHHGKILPVTLEQMGDMVKIDVNGLHVTLENNADTLIRETLKTLQK